jgi:hypothetical protein
MDPLARASVGLMARPFAPQAPLWALIAATHVPDALSLSLMAVGIERGADTQLDLAHGLQYLSQPSIAWSHGLLMTLVLTSCSTLLPLVAGSPDQPRAGAPGLQSLVPGFCGLSPHAPLVRHLASSRARPHHLRPGSFRRHPAGDRVDRRRVRHLHSVEEEIGIVEERERGLVSGQVLRSESETGPVERPDSAWPRGQTSVSCGR